MHVEHLSSWLCKNCQHPAERHRIVPTIKHQNGAWSPEHVYCNFWFAALASGDGWVGGGNCGCIIFEPMDNLDYLEAKYAKIL